MQNIPDNAASLGVERCPFLGLREDPQTALAFVSIWNYCHRARPLAAVALGYQGSYCQCTGYAKCPLLVEGPGRPLPPEARIHHGHHSGRRLARHRWRWTAALLLLAGGLLLAWFLWTKPPPAFPAATAALPATAHAGPSQLPAAPAASPARLASETRTPAATRTKAPAATVSPSKPPPVACGYALDEIIGGASRFTIHRAGGGESLDRYALDYNSSVEAILAVNYDLPIPLRIDWLVVIPIGIQDAHGLPAFEPYFPPVGGIGLGELLVSTAAEKQAFLDYNDFSEACEIFSGWVLIPRSGHASSFEP